MKDVYFRNQHGFYFVIKVVINPDALKGEIFDTKQAMYEKVCACDGCIMDEIEDTEIVVYWDKECKPFYFLEHTHLPITVHVIDFINEFKI